MVKKTNIIKLPIFCLSIAISSAVVSDSLTLAPGSGNSTIDVTRNGVPLVNIASPSGAGISHNTFIDYNVDKQGLILNNATAISNTQIGGLVQGNANLAAGSARLILNEVNSTRQSTLKGYTEVAGQQANVIVANPNGISCDGCGFINTPQATLTTGKPRISENTVELSVDKGQVLITAEGLNAKNTSKLSIIAKAVKLNGELHANHLEIITGSNTVNLKTGKITAKGKAGTGVSIDSSVLGGMYANKVKLVGTDRGVGVNLQGLVAVGAGGFNLSSDGKIAINGLQSEKNSAIQSHSSSVTLNNTVFAKDSIVVKAKTQVLNKGSSSADGKITISAATIENRGQLVAGVNNADGQLILDALEKFDNQGLMHASKQLNINTKVLQNSGDIDSKGVATFTLDTLDNSGLIDVKGNATINSRLLINSGLINAESPITISASEAIKNQGTLHLDKLSTIVSPHLDNSQGKINSNARLDLRRIASINNTQGELFGVGLDISANSLNNQQGKVLSSGTITLNALSDNRQGEIIAEGDIRISRAFNNSKGKLHSNASINISADLHNTQGTIDAIADLLIANSRLNNAKGRISANNITLESDQIDNQSGQLHAAGSLSSHSKTLNNQSGELLADQNISVTSSGAIDNSAGSLHSNQALTIRTGGDLNNQSGLLSSVKAMTLNLAGLFRNDQGITSGNGITLNATTGLSNVEGSLQSSASLALQTAGNVDNNKGSILAESALTVAARTLTNSQGQLSSNASINLTASEQINNQTGNITAVSDAVIKADTINNNHGKVVADKLELAVSDALSNQSGQLHAAGTLSSHSKTLNNQSGELLANQNISVTTSGAIDNSAGTLHSNQALTIHTGGDLNNQSGLLSSVKTLALNVTGLFRNDQGMVNGTGVSLDATKGLSNLKGTIQSSAALKLQTRGGLDNTEGKIVSAGDAVLSTSTDINNHKGIIHSDKKLALGSTAGEVDNSAGLLSSLQQLSLTAYTRVLNSLGNILADAGLSIQTNTAGIDNSNGKLIAGTGTKKASITLISRGAINNQHGQILASDKATISSLTAALDNTSGEIIAANTLTLDTPGDIDNSSGKISADHLTLKSQQTLHNRQGQIYSGASGIINSRQLGQVGSINGYGELALTTRAGDLAIQADQQIVSNGRLILNLAGDLNNHGQLSSATQHLMISASSLNNAAGAVISSGLDNTLQLSGDLLNNGRLSGYRDLTVASLNLSNNGAINAGRDLSLSNTNLSNHKTLFSGANMYLYTAGLLHNTEGSNIVAEGDLTIAKNSSNANTTKILNQSATIEAAGNITLFADQLINKKAEFAKQTVTSGTGTEVLLEEKTLKRNVGEIYNAAITVLLTEGDKIKRSEIRIETRYFGRGDKTTTYYRKVNGQWQAFNGGYHQIALESVNGKRYMRYLDLADIHKKILGILEPIADQKRAEGYDLTKNWEYIVERRENRSGSYTETYHALKLRYSGKKHRERKRRLSTQISTEKVSKDSVAAKLLAGGSLDAKVTRTSNYQSLIAANKNLTIEGDRLNNAGEELYRFIHKSGEYEYCYKQCNSFFHSPDYTWAPLPSSSQAAVSGVAGYSTVQAGGSLVINASQVSNSASQSKSNQAPIGLSSTTGVINRADKLNQQTSQTIQGAIRQTLSDTHSATPGKPARHAIQAQTDKQLNGATLQTAASSALTTDYSLPQGQYGLFISNTNPEHPYLIESNPEFTRYTQFIGSSYLSDQLNLDGDKIIKRLGDDLFENRLVRNQIYHQTGRRYLNGYRSDYQQYQTLMKNALSAQQSLSLSYGVALNPAQIARLSDDIVWMETQVVNGQQVLVPRVYLANTSKLRGANLIANDIDIRADTLVNSGALDARRDLRLSASNRIDNLGGSLRAKRDFTANAADTFLNRSGRVTAGKIDIAATNIIVETAATKKKTRHAKNQLETETRIDDTASITATEGDLTLNAQNKLRLTGAKISGANTVDIAAARVTINTSVQDNNHDFAIRGGHDKGQTIRHLQTDISANNVQLSASEADLDIKGATIRAADDVHFAAKGDLNITAVKNRDFSDHKLKVKGSFGRREQSREIKDKETVLGSTITAANDILLNTRKITTADGKEKIIGNNSGKVTIAGSGLNSANDTVVYAQKGVEITTQSYTDYEKKTMKKRGSFGLHKSESIDMERTQKESGSLLSAGGKTTIVSVADIDVAGSTVVSEADTNLHAVGDINLGTAAENNQSLHYSKSSKIGFSSSGASVSFGQSKVEDKQTQKSTIRRGSTIGSIAGNVNIIAEGDVNTKATDLIAAVDVNLVGQDVNLEAAANNYQNTQQHQQSFAGITASLGGKAGAAVNHAVAANQNLQSASNAQDARTKELYRIAAARNAYDSYQGAAEIAEVVKDPSSASVNVSVGFSSAKNSSSSDSTVHHGGQINAGGDVNVIASGDKSKEKGNITITGLSDTQQQDADGKIHKSAGIEAENIRLIANNQLTVQSSLDTEKNRSSNSSKGASIGVTAGSGGTGVNLSANRGKGHANADSTRHNDSSVTARNKLTLYSGADTHLNGAQLNGKQISADIKGDLNIASTQDSYSANARQDNAGISVTIGPSSSASANYANSKGNADYQSVNKQSGLIAGEHGYDIKVGGNTDLKGAVISATADKDKKQLSTHTLSYTDLKNHASHNVSTKGVSISTGSAPSISPTQKDTGNQTSSSRAVVEGTLTIRDQEKQQQSLTALSTTLKGSHQTLNKTPDINKIIEQQKATQKAQLQAGKALAKTVGDIGAAITARYNTAELKKAAAEGLLQDALASGDSAKAAVARAAIAEAEAIITAEQGSYELWKEGGTARTTLHAITQAYVGDASGSAGQAAAGVLGGEYLADKAEAHARANGVTDPAAIKQIRGAASSLGGAIAAGSAGAHAGATVEANNRQLHQKEIDFIEKNLSEIKKKLKESGLYGAYGHLTDEELLALAYDAVIWGEELDYNKKSAALSINIGDSRYGGDVGNLYNAMSDLINEMKQSDQTYIDSNGVERHYFSRYDYGLNITNMPPSNDRDDLMDIISDFNSGTWTDVPMPLTAEQFEVIVNDGELAAYLRQQSNNRMIRVNGGSPCRIEKAVKTGSCP